MQERWYEGELGEPRLSGDRAFPLRAGRRGCICGPAPIEAIANVVTANVVTANVIGTNAGGTSTGCAGRRSKCGGPSPTAARLEPMVVWLEPTAAWVAIPTAVGCGAGMVLARAVQPALAIPSPHPTWTGCSIVRALFQKTPKNRLFLPPTARRPGLVGVLPQNGLRQEHRQVRRAGCDYCPSARYALERTEV